MTAQSTFSPFLEQHVCVDAPSDFGCVAPELRHSLSGGHRERRRLANVSLAYQGLFTGLHALCRLTQNKCESGRTNEPRYQPADNHFRTSQGGALLGRSDREINHDPARCKRKGCNNRRVSFYDIGRSPPGASCSITLARSPRSSRPNAERNRELSRAKLAASSTNITGRPQIRSTAENSAFMSTSPLQPRRQVHGGRGTKERTPFDGQSQAFLLTCSTRCSETGRAEPEYVEV